MLIQFNSFNILTFARRFFQADTQNSAESAQMVFLEDLQVRSINRQRLIQERRYYNSLVHPDFGVSTYAPLVKHSLSQPSQLKVNVGSQHLCLPYLRGYCLSSKNCVHCVGRSLPLLAKSLPVSLPIVCIPTRKRFSRNANVVSELIVELSI